MLTWRNKMLWVLGFLAAFWGVSSFSAFERVFSVLTQSARVPALPGPAAFSVLTSATTGGKVVAFVLGLLMVGILLALLWLTTTSRGGLIFALARRMTGKPAPASDALRHEGSHFWPLLGIAILSRLDILLYLLVLPPLVTLREQGHPAALLLFVLAFVVASVITFALTFLGFYASAYLVLGGERFSDAIRLSIALAGRFWLVSLELALILYLLTLLVGVAFLVVGAMVATPLLLLSAITSLLGTSALSAVITGVTIALLIVLLFLVGAALVTFQFACWTLLYLRIVEQGAVAKVMRLTARFGHILHRKIV